MIEIVFSESACGSLKMAQSYGKGPYSSGAIGIIMDKSEGSEPTQKEIEEARKSVQEKERLAWEQATPLGGTPADVFCFNLMLSIGDITEGGFAEKRQEALANLYNTQPHETSCDWMDEIERRQKAVYRRIANGETARIWYSDNPDEACGLCWFVAGLFSIKKDIGEIRLVKLPSWESETENTISQLRSWGEVHPGKWQKYLDRQETVPEIFVNKCFFEWKELQKQNAPLRAVINGQLQGVSETIYDSFIVREIEQAKDEFLEAEILGQVLGKYGLGISDLWVAYRIGKMIEQGSLSVLSEPPEGYPFYHRMLKKRN